MIQTEIKYLIDAVLRHNTAKHLFDIYKKNSKHKITNSALFCLRRATVLGLTEAQIEFEKLYGKFSKSGDFCAKELFEIYKENLPKITNEGVQCLHRAAELELPDAQLELARVFWKLSNFGDLSAREKYRETYRKKFWKWLKKAADNGSPAAQFKLGTNLFAIDRPIEARKWLVKASNHVDCVILGLKPTDALAAINLLSLGVKKPINSVGSSSSQLPMAVGKWSDDKHSPFAKDHGKWSEKQLKRTLQQEGEQDGSESKKPKGGLKN